MIRAKIPLKKKIIFIVGPTAIGKSEAAVELAKRLNAEILSLDSMQIYKGMDILTSKPPAALRNKIKHHLLSFLAPTKEYNVSQYRRDALKKINLIFRNGRMPLFVGGTGLYLSALADGIFEAKSGDKRIREKLYRRKAPYLYAQLERIDPEASRAIHPNDKKRIIRALEVFKTTGKAISELKKLRKGLRDEFDVRIICLNMERERLYSRIDERVEKMFEAGLVGEVKKLLKLKLSRTAGYAIGIRELKGYFAKQYDLEEAKLLIKRNSRRYAKRQLTWFRKDKGIKWVSVSQKEGPKKIADKLWKKLS